MKKLMFTAACAAMTAGAFAGVAQVYDMTINLKTTECKKSNKAITDACGSHYFYRAQTSVKLEGKFWGCGCPTIANPIADQYGKPQLAWVDDWSCDDNSNSYMFWGKSAAFHHVDFTWELLQIVGKKSSDVEGKFNAKFFLCEDGEQAEDETLDLDGAGYGCGKITACEDDESYLNQISSMNGSVVGIYDVVDATALVGCPYCGSETECYPYQFCPCVDILEDKSAAYGTFTLKFNSSLANKIMNGKYIDQAYKFKDFVTAEFACIADAEDPVTTDCEKATKKLTSLEAQLETLETNYATLNAEIAAYNAIIDQCDATNRTLEINRIFAQTAYDQYYYDNTNAGWRVQYKDGSGTPQEDYGTNLTTFTSLITTIKTRVLTFEHADYYAEDGEDLCTTDLNVAVQYIEDRVTTTDRLATALANAEEAISANDRAKQVAEQGIVANNAKIVALDYANTKAQLNAQIGAQKVVVDQVCD